MPDERNAAEHIRERSPDAVIIWSVPGATHTAALSVAPAEWEKTVVEFLVAALPDQGVTEGADGRLTFLPPWTSPEIA